MDGTAVLKRYHSEGTTPQFIQILAIPAHIG